MTRRRSDFVMIFSITKFRYRWNRGQFRRLNCCTPRVRSRSRSGTSSRIRWRIEFGSAPLTDEDYLRLTIEIARAARAAGNHPFGAILVGPDGKVLLQAGNAHGDAGDRTGHAERVLMTQASVEYTAAFL